MLAWEDAACLSVVNLRVLVAGAFAGEANRLVVLVARAQNGTPGIASPLHACSALQHGNEKFTVSTHSANDCKLPMRIL